MSDQEWASLVKKLEKRALLDRVVEADSVTNGISKGVTVSGATDDFTRDLAPVSFVLPV